MIAADYLKRIASWSRELNEREIGSRAPVLSRNPTAPYGEDITIAEFARVVAATVGYRGEISFDPSKPDGTPRKLLDVNRLAKLGWRASTSLENGIRRAYQAYLSESQQAAK